MKTLVIVPAYNEQDSIIDLVKSLKELGKDIDFIIINDCSTDNTSTICKSHGGKVIDLPCNLGIGGAVQTGYKYAYKNNYEFAVQVDGDGQHNPMYIKELLTPLISGEADLVIGSRYIEKKGFQSTKLRKIGIKYFCELIYLLTGNKITDPTSGFRACNAKTIKLFANTYPSDYPEPESIVFLYRNAHKINEVPVVMQERIGGQSSIRSFKSIYYMLKVSIAIVIDCLRKKPVFLNK